MMPAQANVMGKASQRYPDGQGQTSSNREIARAAGSIGLATRALGHATFLALADALRCLDGRFSGFQSVRR